MIIDFEKVVHYHAEIDDKKFNDEFGNFHEDSLINYCENTIDVNDECWIDFDEIQNIYWKKDENDKVHVMDKSFYEKFVEERENAERCYECSGYGDDYSTDENGNMISNCDNCPFNMINFNNKNKKIDIEEFIEEFKSKVYNFYACVVNIKDVKGFVDTLFKETSIMYISVNSNNRIILYAKNPTRFIKDDMMWNFLQNWVNETYDRFMAMGIFDTNMVTEDDLFLFE